jgi:hypothetical protein
MLPAALFILSIAMLAAAMTRTAMLCYSAFAIPTPARIKGGRACPQSQGQISRIEPPARLWPQRYTHLCLCSVPPHPWCRRY